MVKRFYIIYSSILVVLFCISFQKRAEHFGKISLWNHQYLTGSTLKFTGNWYREGFFKLNGAMVENPKSIEFGDDIKSRTYYVSYGTGSQLPVFWIAKLLNREPDLKIIQGWNLFNQFVVAWLLGVIVFIIFKDLPFSWRSALSFIPPVLYLFLPHPMYWHMSVYFSDQAVILWIVLVLFCEIKIEESSTKGKMQLLQSLFIFWGTFTDWLMVFVAIFLLIKRLAEVKFSIKYAIKNGLSIAMPSLLAGGLVVLQTVLLGSWDELLHRGMQRVSNAEPGFTKPMDFFTRYWKGYIGVPDWYILLISAALLIVATFVYFKKNKKIPRIYSIPLILFFAFLAHTYILKNHAKEHDFSALKWQLLLALVPFSLLPGSFYLIASNRGWILKSSMGILMLSGFFLIIYHFSQISEKFPKPELYAMDVCQYLRSNSKYEDVYFSPDFEIKENPPQLIAIGLKRVYKAMNLDEIMRFLQSRRIEEKANVKVLFYDDGEGCKPNTDNFVVRNAVKISSHIKVYSFEKGSIKKLGQNSILMNQKFCLR